MWKHPQEDVHTEGNKGLTETLLGKISRINYALKWWLLYKQQKKSKTHFSKSDVIFDGRMNLELLISITRNLQITVDAIT